MAIRAKLLKGVWKPVRTVLGVVLSLLAVVAAIRPLLDGEWLYLVAGFGFFAALVAIAWLRYRLGVPDLPPEEMPAAEQLNSPFSRS